MKEYIFTNEIQQNDVIFTTRFELRRRYSHCFPNRYRSHIFFFVFLFFLFFFFFFFFFLILCFWTKLASVVMHFLCFWAKLSSVGMHFLDYNVRSILVTRLFSFAGTFFVFVFPALHMWNTERLRHDVHVLFGDVSYDIRNAHWRVNNWVKEILLFFQWIQWQFSSRVMKTFISLLVLRTHEIMIFFLLHSMKILSTSPPKSKLPLYMHFSSSKPEKAGLGGSVGCAVRLETRRSRVQPPLRSVTLFRGDWSWNIFYGHSLPSADSRRAVVGFWRKNVHNTG